MMNGKLLTSIIAAALGGSVGLNVDFLTSRLDENREIAVQLTQIQTKQDTMQISLDGIYQRLRALEEARYRSEGER